MSTLEGVRYHQETIEEHIVSLQFALHFHQYLANIREDEKPTLSPEEIEARSIDTLITYHEQRIFEIEEELRYLGVLENS